MSSIRFWQVQLLQNAIIPTLIANKFSLPKLLLTEQALDDHVPENPITRQHIKI